MEYEITKVLRSLEGGEGTLLISCKVENVSELARLCAAFSTKEDTRVVEQAVPQQEEAERPISQEEATAFLGLTRQGFYNLRRRGLVRSFKLGGRLFYYKSQLLSALQEC